MDKRQRYRDAPGWSFETEEVAQSFWAVRGYDSRNQGRIWVSGSGRPEDFERAALAAAKLIMA